MNFTKKKIDEMEKKLAFLEELYKMQVEGLELVGRIIDEEAKLKMAERGDISTTDCWGDNF